MSHEYINPGKYSTIFYNKLKSILERFVINLHSQSNSFTKNCVKNEICIRLSSLGGRVDSSGTPKNMGLNRPAENRIHAWNVQIYVS